MYLLHALDTTERQVPQNEIQKHISFFIGKREAGVYVNLEGQ